MLALTILDRKNAAWSGWQLAQCRRAEMSVSIPMALAQAFLFSQESARWRREWRWPLWKTQGVYGSHFAQAVSHSVKSTFGSNTQSVPPKLCIIHVCVCTY